MSEVKRQVIVARFDNRSEAQKALKALNKTIKSDNVELRQGALVTRAPDGILEIEKLNDNSLSKLGSDAVNLTTYVVAGSAKIVASTVRASFGLLTNGLGRAGQLAGSVMAVSANRARTFTGGDKPLRRIGGTLAPGAAAIMVVVDAAHADEVAAILNGGAPLVPANAAADISIDADAIAGAVAADDEDEAAPPLHDIPM
jgi:uncharacterized membrane protein